MSAMTAYQAQSLGIGGLGCGDCAGCPSKGMGCPAVSSGIGAIGCPDAGLGCASCPLSGMGCPVGLGQPVQGPGAVSSIVGLIDSIIGVGAKFIPETKEMQQRREEQLEIERQKAAAAASSAAEAGKTIATVAGIGLLGYIAYRVLGKKRR